MSNAENLDLDRLERVAKAAPTYGTQAYVDSEYSFEFQPPTCLALIERVRNMEVLENQFSDMCESVWPLIDLLHDGRPQAGHAPTRLVEAIGLVRKLKERVRELEEKHG